MPLAAQPVTEFNVARLGLISIQTRLPAHVAHGWSSDPNQPGGVSCVATSPRMGAAHGLVPHGLDGDIFAALVTEAVIACESGLPDQPLRLTTADLMRHAAVDIHDRHYSVVEGSLGRLRHSNVQVWSQWEDALVKNSRNASFSILDLLAHETQEHKFNPAQSSRIHVMRLNQEIQRSVQGDLVLAVDPKILKGLHSPVARGLYRMLEAWRRDSQDVTRAKAELIMELPQLVESARLYATRHEPMRLLNSLKGKGGAFEQLRAVGYLQSITEVGRGWDLKLKFVFADSGQVIDLVARKLLLEAGVTGSHAESLPLAHGREEIECAIWLVDKKKKVDTSIRNPAGLVVKSLKDGTARDMLEKFRNRNRSYVNPKPTLVSLIESTPEPSSAVEAMDQAASLVKSLVALRKLASEQGKRLTGWVKTGQLNLETLRGCLALSTLDLQKQVGKWDQELN
jgi:hypothetical protein